MTDSTRWQSLLADITATHAHAPWWVTGVAALLAAAAVLTPRAWPVTRNVVTIAHEGGHALVARLCGRRLDGIRLHSDTSGVTVSSGRPTGPGMVATAFAGYVAPSLAGLAAAAAVGHGRSTGLLAATLALLLVMVVFLRNAWGFLTVTVAGAAVAAVLWWAPVATHVGFAGLLAWFLLLAGPRPVWELHAKRRRGLAPESDADQLAALTGVPGVVWVALFALVSLACLGLGATWMFT